MKAWSSARSPLRGIRSGWSNPPPSRRRAHGGDRPARSPISETRSCSPTTPEPTATGFGGWNPCAQATRELGSLVRARTSLVEARTAASNQLWAILAEHWPGAGCRIPEADLADRARLPDRLPDSAFGCPARRGPDASVLPPALLSRRQVPGRAPRPSPSRAGQRGPDLAGGARSNRPDQSREIRLARTPRSPTSNVTSPQHSQRTPKPRCSRRCLESRTSASHR